MQKIKILTFAGLLILAAFVTAAFVNKKTLFKPAKAVADNRGFAVVELFTSEGCSSCPAADALIAKIEKESEEKPVYILAYHVDYWNRLGWKDVFSNAGYSHRQSTYAAWLKLSSVYTPQIIVNGRSEFVGSQEGTLRNAIRAGLRNSGLARLSLEKVITNYNQATISYSAEGVSGKSLVIALIQKNAATEVKSGENRGRMLSHVQIVSQIKTISLTGINGKTQIALPTNFIDKDFELIAFVQNPNNGEILAATRSNFPVALNAAN